jgi:hypothetical protein
VRLKKVERSKEEESKKKSKKSQENIKGER